MSQEISKRYGGKLPFLFKVLSIRKALSIQAHPNKKLAEKLHIKDPKNYPGITASPLIHPFLTRVSADDNHKPEMTIAVTPFDGLCGFRPLSEIAHFLSHVPSLRNLVGESTAKEFQEAVRGHERSNLSEDVLRNKKALQAAFSALMNSEKPAVISAAKALISSAKEDGESFAGHGGPSNGGQELADLVVRLNSQFEGDIGLFVLFFLNYVKLEIGEAMFLKADDIHAYLSGGIHVISSPQNSRSGLETPTFIYMVTSPQISSNAWLLRTTSSALASLPSIKISLPSPACSHTPTLPYQSKKCLRFLTLT